jgi:hypothetical protein
MDTNTVLPVGWALGSGTSLPQTANLRFWEYQSVDLSGTPVNTGSRASWSAQIDGATATNQVQNVTNWFGGWLPRLAPNILAQPTNVTVYAGQTANLTVGATGIPAPGYQWLRSGTNVPGATSATLSITNAQVADADSYSVVVSNAGGAVTSSVAVLTVITIPQPAISAPSWNGSQFSLTVNGQSGLDYAVQFSTNLVNWQTVFITNSPALPFSWTDPNSGTYPVGFYRILAGPSLP